MPGSAGLAARIARRIRREGPLSIAAYMAIALHDADAGYYANRDPFGTAGDFVTAPEISQIFGELIGACLIDYWQRVGRPDPVILAELGPGRGTLMADLLRAARVVPEFRRALRLHLVEASPVLRQEQQRRLAAAAPELAPRFADGIDALPDGPLLLVANEFLDALPIRQFVRGRTGWTERLVALDPRRANPNRSAWSSPRARKAPPSRCWFRPSLRAAPPGTVVEICPAAAALAASLGERLARQPGLALFIDYGYFPSRPGATLAALRRHRVGADPRHARRGRSQRPCRFCRFRRGGDGRRRRVARSGAAARFPARPRRRGAARGAVAARHPGAARRARKRPHALDRSGTDGQFVQGAGPDLAGTAGSGRFRVAHSRWHPVHEDRATMSPPC